MSRNLRAAFGAALVCGAVAAAPSTAPAAEVMYGVTEQNRLFRFAADAPGGTSEPVQVTGLLQADERIVGMDVRPNTDQLYAVTTGNRAYTVNPVTGAVRPAINPIGATLSGGLFGVDVNPQADALRITSDAEQSLRIAFASGRTFTDGALNYPADDPGAGSDPAVTASAYINAVPGATSTTLFGIDVARDAVVRQDPPNAGTLRTVGPLGFDAAHAAGFDVAADGTAYAAIQRAGSATVELHRIDLATGRATPATAAPTIAVPGGGATLRGMAALGRTDDDRTRPEVSVSFSSTILEQNTDRLRPSVSCDEACRVEVVATVDGRSAGRGSARLARAGRATVEVRVGQAARAAIGRPGTELIALRIVATDAAGNETTQRRRSRTQTLGARRAAG
jgi:hypothetical protein